MTEFTVVKPNVVTLTPGGTYNLNEENLLELAVVKLHLLIREAELAIEELCTTSELGTYGYLTSTAEVAFSKYEQAIARGPLSEFELWVNRNLNTPEKWKLHNTGGDVNIASFSTVSAVGQNISLTVDSHSCIMHSYDWADEEARTANFDNVGIWSWYVDEGLEELETKLTACLGETQQYCISLASDIQYLITAWKF